METTKSKFETLEGLAAEFHLPQRYLRDLANQGKIPFLNVGGRLRFNPRAVADALDRIAVRGGNHAGD
jgi:hypothetical protein